MCLYINHSTVQQIRQLLPPVTAVDSRSVSLLDETECSPTPLGRFMQDACKTEPLGET